MLTELATALIGFLAGLADFSVGAGFDALAVPSLILIGVDPQIAIAEGLFAQAVSSTLFGAVKHRAIVSKRGAVVVMSSSASALALSLLSLSLNPVMVEAAVGFVLLTLSLVLVLKVVKGRPNRVSDPPVGEARLAVLALGAGAVKGLAGSGMSAVMMLGQLVMGVGMGQAVVMAVALKSIPATAALIPRALGGGLNISGAVLLAAGAIASITVAERARVRLGPRALESVLCCYSVAVGSYLILKALVAV